MKPKSLLAASVALTFSAVAVSSIAAESRIDLLGDPAPSSAATRTIVIGPDTKWVNVTGGETVKFVAGGKTFAWSFNTAPTVSSFELNRVAPPGTLDRRVTVYIAPDPRYIGGDRGHDGNGR